MVQSALKSQKNHGKVVINKMFESSNSKQTGFDIPNTKNPGFLAFCRNQSARIGSSAVTPVYPHTPETGYLVDSTILVA